MTDGLDVIEPVKRTVMVAGEAVELSPLTIGELPRMVAAIRGFDLSNGLDLNDLVNLIADHGEQIIDAVQIGSRLPREKIAALLPDQFLELLAAVLEVNTDFFVRRLAPAMTERLAGNRAGTGATPFSH